MVQCNKMCSKIHKPITPKGKTMFDFFKPIELNRTYQQTEKAIKDAYDFWIGVAIDTFTMYKNK